jgi:hypothetical protein
MTKTKFYLLLFVGVVAFVGWAVMAAQDPALRPDLLTLLKSTVVGLVALVLRDMPPPSTPTAPAVVPVVPAAPAAQPA